MDSVFASTSPHSELAPNRTDLQTRPPILFPSPADIHASRPMHPSHTGTQPPNRRPLPPPKPKRPSSPADEEQPQYITPRSPDPETGGNDSSYFILSPTGQSVLEDGPQAAYEEMEYDEDDMNRNPPPVWKPPSSPSIIYSRVERGKVMDPPHANTKERSPQPPALRSQCSPNPSVRTPQKPVQRPSPSRSEESRKSASKPLPKSRPVRGKGPPPPTKPKPTSPQHRPADQGAMRNVLSDPGLFNKLQEKRQELYGGVATTARSSTSSFGSQDPMENYEEVCFDLAAADASGSDDEEEHSSPAFSRVSNMTLPPRRHNVGSEVAMMQCLPEQPRAQAYLQFQRSRSPSPHDYLEEASNRDSYSSVNSLSPNVPKKQISLGNDDQPPLPPRVGERMRGSPRLQRKQLPTVPDTRSRPVPAKRVQPVLQREKSFSQENLRMCNLANPHNQPPRPASSSLDEPPPPPRTLRTHSRSPQPPNLRDLSRPMPLPVAVKPAGPPQPQHRQGRKLPSVESDSETPPPVPLRHPDASGGSLVTQSASALEALTLQVSQPSRSVSVPVDDFSPPVPSRGARRKDERVSQSASSLLRSQGTPTPPSAETRAEIRPKPRPSVKPSNAGEGNTQQLAPTPSGNVSNGHVHRAPISRPRPPVSTKPPTSAKPRPLVSPKPPVSSRPGSKKPLLPTSRKTPHTTRTVPVEEQNGQIPPPLPPR